MWNDYRRFITPSYDLEHLPIPGDTFVQFRRVFLKRSKINTNWEAKSRSTKILKHFWSNRKLEETWGKIHDNWSLNFVIVILLTVFVKTESSIKLKIRTIVRHRHPCRKFVNIRDLFFLRLSHFQHRLNPVPSNFRWHRSLPPTA